MMHKRDVILQFCSNPDAVLNALHQSGWSVVTKDEAKRITCGGTNCGDCYDCLKVNLHFALVAVCEKTDASNPHMAALNMANLKPK